jgi:folate-binding protein YgfZ
MASGEVLSLREFHQQLGGRFGTVDGVEVVEDYGDFLAEHAALRQTAAILDLSFRSRLCLGGADRVRFLHGQVTSDINGLRPGGGCYAALTNAKGRMQGDANVYCLPDELLLDFEPGMAQAISERFEKFIVADDVQVVDVAPSYGLLSVQGPRAEEVARALGLCPGIPSKPFGNVKIADPALGEVYLMNQPRLRTAGFDWFVPVAAQEALVAKLLPAAHGIGGRVCGWRALETARIEAGIPRFGVDMDETNLPQECGIEKFAVSFTKGCYVGQEVINRVHTMGHVNRELRKLRLGDGLPLLPMKGDKLFHAGKEIGYITSATFSPAMQAKIALGYVRREASEPGTELRLRVAGGETAARVE